MRLVISILIFCFLGVGLGRAETFIPKVSREVMDFRGTPNFSDPEYEKLFDCQTFEELRDQLLRSIESLGQIREEDTSRENVLMVCRLALIRTNYLLGDIERGDELLMKLHPAELQAKGREGRIGKRGGKKNVVLILADDLGYETIGANGGQSYRTPNLDRFAKEGARFEHCYSQPLCTPSRVQIMTGQYNFRNYVKFAVLKRGEKTFAHYLRDAGYATCVAGKWQLGKEKDSPQHFGFDEALLWQHTRGRTRVGEKHDSRYENPRLERNGEEVDFDGGEFAPDLFVDFIGDFVKKKKDQPFFVYYPMVLTHWPFVPTPDSPDWDAKSKGSLTLGREQKHFGGQVQYMDQLVGKIVGELKKQGVLENTIVLFVGDNGTDRVIVSKMDGREVVGGKIFPTDAGTRVPLIVYGPGNVKPSVVRDLVDFSDFLPTICELAGIEKEELGERVDGRSFLPQLLGEKGNPRSWIYSWYQRFDNKPNKPAVVFARNQRYKLYGDGRMFDIQRDVLEKSPLAAEGLNQEQEKVKVLLERVIQGYAKERKK